MAVNKDTMFKFFDYKWSRVPTWGGETDKMYREWYLQRYGYGTRGNLKEFLSNKENILEAGCGPARESVFFSELNPTANLVAIDQSKHAVGIARGRLGSKAEVLCGDISTTKFNREFDFISCDQVLHHSPDPGVTLQNLFLHLKRGGVLNFSVCRKKNPYRDLADDVIMEYAQNLTPEQLWEFSRAVTLFAKALYELNVVNISFNDKHYASLQRYVHDNLFRVWYSPDINFELSVSSNYDWFSGNPRFSLKEVHTLILDKISDYEILREYVDDATISLTIKKT